MTGCWEAEISIGKGGNPCISENMYLPGKGITKRRPQDKTLLSYAAWDRQMKADEDRQIQVTRAGRWGTCSLSLAMSDIIPGSTDHTCNDPIGKIPPALYAYCFIPI